MWVRSLGKVVILLVLVIGVFSQNHSQDMDKYLFEKFQRFITKYNKDYGSLEEFTKRFEIFKQNYDLTHNSTSTSDIPEEDEENTKIGTTQFSDLTTEEFEKQFLTLNANDLPSENDENSENFLDSKDDVIENNNSTDKNLTRLLQTVPSSFDWRTKGAVTSVKTQGSCGACWAFCSVSNIEGLYYKKYKKLISFSEQQLVDCDSSNNGCGGGMMAPAYNYIRRAGGLETRTSYPYKGYKSTCKHRSSLSVARVTGYKFAGSRNEDVIKTFLYNTAPLAVTMNASKLQYYKGGVLTGSCSTNPNHGVTIVGYGTSSTGVPYWIVKNSWGPNWGEGGYFKIRRGTGMCGINNYVISAILG